MRVIYKTERGGLIGSLYSESLGYTYKIRGKIDGKSMILGRSFVYLAHKEKAIELMENNIDALLETSQLFNINDYRKD